MLAWSSERLGEIPWVEADDSQHAMISRPMFISLICKTNNKIKNSNDTKEESNTSRFFLAVVFFAEESRMHGKRGLSK
jgi:hypothetical protein